MSIQSEISRIQSNVQDTINVIQSTGVAVPPGANSDNLPGLAAALANEKQDKLTGTQGQVVGFDAEGNAVAQDQGASNVSAENVSVPDTTASLYGLEDATVDQVLQYLGQYAQYWWKRRTAEQNYYTFNEVTEDEAYNIASKSTMTKIYWKTGSSYTTDAETGIAALVNPTAQEYYTGSTTTGIANTINSNLYGKYYARSGTGSTVYKLLRQVTASDIAVNSSYSDVWDLKPGVSKKVEPTLVHVDVGEWEYVQSSNRSAYPDSGVQDGYEYQYIGVPFQNAINPSKIATGSYVGTGTYGQNNPNTLTFDFTPKLWGILCYTQSGAPTLVTVTFRVPFGLDVTGGQKYLVAFRGSNLCDIQVHYIGQTAYWNAYDYPGSSPSATEQFNEVGCTYYYVAIG